MSIAKGAALVKRVVFYNKADRLLVVKKTLAFEITLPARGKNAVSKNLLRLPLETT